MQKIILVPLLILATLLCGASAREVFEVPCRSELQAMQSLVAQQKWAAARDGLVRFMKECQDAVAMRVAARLSEYVPGLLVEETQGFVDVKLDWMEVGLTFEGGWGKAVASWFFRAPRSAAQQVKRVVLTHEASKQVVFDSEAGNEQCDPEYPWDEEWTCISNEELDIMPVPGLYQLEVYASAGKLVLHFIFPGEHLPFDAIYLDSPGAGFRSYRSSKIPYVVSGFLPGQKMDASEFVFSLYKKDGSVPTQKWKYPANRFAIRGFIDVPSEGDYHLEFASRNVRDLGRLRIVLQNVTGRWIRFDSDGPKGQ